MHTHLACVFSSARCSNDHRARAPISRPF